MNTPIKHVVFDIGGVLLAYNVELPFRRLITDAAKRHWFLTEVCTTEWNIEQDRGRSWSDAEDILIAQYPDEEELIRAYRKNWSEMITHPHQDTVNTLLSMIQRGVDVTLLSNWNDDTFEEIRHQYTFLNKPRGATISGRVGLIKPDPAIFEHHAIEYGCSPADSLFIDDNAQNVATARQCGWHSIHYLDHASFENDLTGFTVLSKNS